MLFYILFQYPLSFFFAHEKFIQKSTDNIFEKFRDIIKDHEQPIGYTVHCEAALVAFASTKNNEILGLFQFHLHSSWLDNNPSVSSISGQSKSQRLRDMMAKFLTGCLDAADDPGDERESNSVSWNGIDFDVLGDSHF